MSGVPSPSGSLNIRNCQVTSGGLPNGALYALVNVTSIVIENAAIRVLQKDTFQASTKMIHLSLSYNPFIYLQSDMFLKATSLNVLELYGIDWACTCTNIWPIEYCSKNNITLKGNLVCGSPTAYANVRGQSYDKEQCPQPNACEGTMGIAIGFTCLPVYDLIYYGLLFVTLLTSLVAFAIAVHSKRQFNAHDATRRKKRLGCRK